MATPLPTQLCTWHPQNYTPGDLAPTEGQWLYCLKDTDLGSRQIVWTGLSGGGLVAVVDFGHEVRLRTGKRGLYEGWGRITPLATPVTVEEARTLPVLRDRFAGPRAAGLRGGPARVDRMLAEAIAASTALPPVAEPTPAKWAEAGGVWGPDVDPLPYEDVAESEVLGQRTPGEVDRLPFGPV